MSLNYHPHRVIVILSAAPRRHPKKEPDMLTIGDRFPEFKQTAVVSLEKGKEFAELSSADYPGKWKVVFFWPKDFTFVCPTEIAEFGRRNADFQDRDAQVLRSEERRVGKEGRSSWPRYH